MRMLKLMMQNIKTAMTVVMMFSCTSALAAIDGQLGTTSTGYLGIQVGISNSFKISRIDDINMTINNRDLDVVIREPLCIRGIGSDRYTFTASVANTSKFELVNEQGDTLPFLLLFYSDIDQKSFEQITPNSADKEFEVKSAEVDCGGEDSSAIEIVLQSADLKEAASTVYSGVLVLTVGSL